MKSIKKTLANILFIILTLFVILYFNGFSLSFKLGVGEYTYTSWLFNYDYGFMRRALPGFLLSEFNINNDYSTVRFISSFILIISYSLFSYVFFIIMKKIDLRNYDAYIYFFCAMSLPFFLPQWLFLLGKFDYIVQIFILICFILITSGKNKKIVFPFILLTILIASLCHEANLIIFLPTIILIFHLKYKDFISSFLLVVVTLFSIVLVSIFGKIDVNHANILVEKYEYHRGFNVYAVRTTVLSLFDNIILNIISFFHFKTYIPLILILIFFSPIILFFREVTPKKIHLYYVVCFSPAALFIIAFDYYRWISLVFFNIFLLTFYFIESNFLNVNKIRFFLIKNKKTIFYYCLVCLILGPLGDSQLFPKFLRNNIGGLPIDNVPTNILTKLNFAQDTNKQIFEVNRNVKGWDIENDFSKFDNLTQAKLWYEKQSLIGNSYAQNNLALMYIRGGKIPIDYNKAIKLLLTSAKSGNAVALNNLGVMYANGLGVNKDNEKALYYYKSSEKLSCPTAMYNIGISYKKGLNGLKKDDSKARDYFLKASNFNYSLAILELKKKN